MDNFIGRLGDVSNDTSTAMKDALLYEAYTALRDIRRNFFTKEEKVKA